MLSLTAATGLGFALAVLVTPPSFAAAGDAAAQPAQPAPTSTPEPEQCRTVDFEKATLTPIASTGAATSVRYRLTVSGTKPSSDVKVKLTPLVYVRQPEFWGIQVTGCSSGIGLPVLTPYTATYDFTAPMGSCGIEVVGASRRQQFDLAGCGTAPVAGTRWDLDPASLGVTVPPGVTIGVDFTATQITGFTGCNTFGGDYSLGPDGSFTVGRIAMTARACEPPVSTVESAFLKALTSTTHLRVAKAELLFVRDGKTLMRFVPAPSGV